MHELIGQTIKEIYISSKKIAFVTNEKTFFYEVEGDCCSESYFYEIINLSKILGKVVLKVKEINDVKVEKGSEDRGVEYADSVDAYGIRLSTDETNVEIAGEILPTSNSAIIVFRNNSNGYYGGSCEFRGHDGDLSGLKRIENDWLIDV